MFTDVAIDWGGLEVTDLYPRRLPDVFAAAPLVVHGRYRHAGRATVRIHGSTGGQRYERALDVTLPGPGAGAAGRVQETIWARAAVRDRENRDRAARRPGDREGGRDLGLRHHLVTPYTSFVAVDAAAAPTAAAPPRAHLTITPARGLPGDPEIANPGAGRRALGHRAAAVGRDHRGALGPDPRGRGPRVFLIPSDAASGSAPLDVFVTLADGATRHRRVWYEVDTTAPALRLEVVGAARPGGTVAIRAIDPTGRRSDVARVSARVAGVVVPLAAGPSQARGRRPWIPAEPPAAAPSRWSRSISPATSPGGPARSRSGG